MENKIYLAVDSGGSKTLWSLIDGCGVTLYETKTAGLGAIREGILPIDETVRLAAKELMEIASPSAIFLSLGGPNTSEVETALKKHFPNKHVKVEREACGEAILRAAAYMNCSSVVMCGTGSVAVGDTANGRKYCGGWGPVYGDGGSGGGMGQDALKLYLRDIDGFESSYGLRDIFAFLSDGLDLSEFKDRMELKNRAVNLDRRTLASFAPRIYELWESGDAQAEKLYSSAAREIAEMAYLTSDDKSDTQVLLCGGFFANKPLLLDKCREELKKKSRAKIIYYPAFSPTIAAKIAVLEENGEIVDEEIFKRILKNERK
ncbi:MAG: hypothetical protein J6L83_09700 [Clostridia bacterium]|nr:hypothetical protein [Clostridia bacterium]